MGWFRLVGDGEVFMDAEGYEPLLRYAIRTLLIFSHAAYGEAAGSAGSKFRVACEGGRRNLIGGNSARERLR